MPLPSGPCRFGSSIFELRYICNKCSTFTATKVKKKWTWLSTARIPIRRHRMTAGNNPQLQAIRGYFVATTTPAYLPPNSSVAISSVPVWAVGHRTIHPMIQSILLSIVNALYLDFNQNYSCSESNETIESIDIKPQKAIRRCSIFGLLHMSSSRRGPNSRT